MRSLGKARSLGSTCSRDRALAPLSLGAESVSLVQAGDFETAFSKLTTGHLYPLGSLSRLRQTNHFCAKTFPPYSRGARGPELGFPEPADPSRSQIGSSLEPSCSPGFFQSGERLRSWVQLCPTGSANIAVSVVSLL